MPVQELQQKTTSMEFVMWMEYLDREESQHDKMDYYLAQIAAEVRRSYVEKPKKVRIQDLMLKFEQPSPKKEMDLDSMTRSHKQFWFASLGLKNDGTS